MTQLNLGCATCCSFATFEQRIQVCVDVAQLHQGFIEKSDHILFTLWLCHSVEVKFQVCHGSLQWSKGRLVVYTTHSKLICVLIIAFQCKVHFLDIDDGLLGIDYDPLIFFVKVVRNSVQDHF